MTTLNFRSYTEMVHRMPQAIWIPHGGDLPAFYRGSPLEMVQAMGAESECDSVPHTVQVISAGLKANRWVTITLPKNLPDAELAGLFVYALLATGIAQEMPRA